MIKPTNDELDTAINKKNVGYTIGNADYTDITNTSATMTGKTLYKGSALLSYSKV